MRAVFGTLLGVVAIVALSVAFTVDCTHDRMRDVARPYPAQCTCADTPATLGYSASTACKKATP